MGMSYRAAMVPMMLTVVGMVLTPTSVTDTVGMGTLSTGFFTAKAWVSRMANKTTTAAMTVPIAAASQKLRRLTDWEAIV
jgi:Sec-independent protein secretion pathway component TatC